SLVVPCHTCCFACFALFQVSPRSGKFPMEASLRNQVDLNLINLGCGYLARPHWKNFDLNPQLPYVQKWRLGQQVMLAAGAADAIYHSHFMEHLSYPEAVNLLRE